MIVCKFGGSSMAHPEKVLSIVKSSKCDVIVVSAPGKSEAHEEKVTDLLVKISKRFNCFEYDYIVSRGEFIMAKLFAKISGYNFADAKDYIVINQNGKVNERLTKQKLKALKIPCVMGGFYGSDIYGQIKTFARGGSDYTGAIVASLLGAKRYEVFTDVPGVYDENKITIPQLSYDELYRMNVPVMYNDCLPLLKKYKVPLVVKNTFAPSGGYTLVQ